MGLILELPFSFSAMNCWVVIGFLVTAVGADSMGNLERINVKLDEIEVLSQKIEDFVSRCEYYHTYCVPIAEQLLEYEGMVHEHSEHSLFIINEEYVALLEKINGHLDFVIDTSTMDSIG